MTAIRLRRGTAAEWAAVNPVLASGEPGYEIDTNRYKIGNGSAAWSALDYHIPKQEVSSLIAAAVAAGGGGGGGASGPVTYETLPAGTRIVVNWSPTTGFPPRPTARTDIYVDVRMPLAAGDPPVAIPPATDGFYSGIDAREIIPEA